MATFTEQEWHELFTSTKTTVSTVLDSDGVLKNTLHNLLPSTDLSDTAVWPHEGLASVVASGTSPSGKTAYLVTEDTSTGNHRLYDGVSWGSGVYVKASIDFKPNGRDIYFRAYHSAGAPTWAFSSSTLTATQLSGGSSDAGFIADLGGGWYRADMYWLTTDSGNAFYYSLGSAFSAYTGDGSSGVYLSRPRVYRAAVHAPVERVTNGDFATDISGWTQTGNDASNYWEWASGAARVVSAGTFVPFSQVMLTAGELYRIELDVTVVTGGIKIGSSATGAYNDIAANISSSGAYVYTFTALSSTLYFGRYSGVTDVSIDNVSVTKVITNGMQTDLSGSDYVETSGSAEFHAGLEYDGNGAFRGLQAFEGRTNLVTYSNPNAYLVANAVTQTAVSGLDGDLTACEVEDTGNSDDYIHRTGTITSSTNSYTTQVLVKKTTGITNYPAVFVYYSGGTAKSYAVVMNSNTGAVASSTSSPTVSVQDIGDWWEYSIVTADNGTGNTSLQVRLYPAWNTDGTTARDNAATGTATFANVMTAQGSSPSPYIPTNGSTVSRGADVTFKALSEFGFKQDQYTVIVEFESAGSDGADYPRVFQLDDDDASGNNQARLMIDINDDLSQVSRVNGSNDVFSVLNTAFPSDTLTKVAATWKQNDFAASDNGDAVVTDSLGEVPPTTVLRVGCDNVSAHHLNGYIKKMVIYPARLTDATLVAESA